MLYPTPAHLRDCLVIDQKSSNAHELNGTIRCHCGSEVSSLLYVAQLIESGSAPLLRVMQMQDGFFLRIGAQCVLCSQTHLLFDHDFHGWNGFICPSHGVRQRDRPPYETLHCHRCGATTQRISLGIVGDKDKDEMIEEAGGILDESDWFEGFGWFAVDVTCTGCGYGPVTIVDYETR